MLRPWNTHANCATPPMHETAPSISRAPTFSRFRSAAASNGWRRVPHRDAWAFNRPRRSRLPGATTGEDRRACYALVITLKTTRFRSGLQAAFALALLPLPLSGCMISGLDDVTDASVSSDETSRAAEPSSVDTGEQSSSTIAPTTTQPTKDQPTKKPGRTTDEPQETTSAPSDDGTELSPVETHSELDASVETPTSESHSSAEVTSEPDVTSASGPRFHLFLLLGQSNMSGYPKTRPADLEENERIQVLGYDSCSATGRNYMEWDVAAPPLHECWTDAIGPGDYFAKTLLPSLPPEDTIGLIPCAVSGERIETFLKEGGARYPWIISRARTALESGGVIEGILMHQGESNTGDPAWPAKVKMLVDDLRVDLELGDVPFLAGELPYDGDSASHNTLVAQLPTLIDNAWLVSAEGLIVDPTDTQWNLHFDHDSQVTLGQRYADVLKTALGW